MHSRIFQLSHNQHETPIDCDFVEEFGFVAYPVDYVIQSFDIQEDIERLAECYEDLPISVENNTITFHKGFKEQYFTQKLETVKECANNLDLDKLLHYVPYELCHVDSNMEGYKVYTEAEGIYDFDDFVRFSIDEDVPYTVINTIDYHY